MLPKIREYIRSITDDDQWNLHVVPVVRYAKHLAEIEGVDAELVEMAALLHDVGRFTFGGKDHEVTGVPEADKLLRGLGAPEAIIEEVKHCISTHRGSGENLPKTKVATIIRDADALSHFDVVPWLIEYAAGKYGLKEGLGWVDSKLDRDWNRKLHLPESRRLAEEKYKAAKLLLKANLELYPK